MNPTPVEKLSKQVELALRENFIKPVAENTKSILLCSQIIRANCLLKAVSKLVQANHSREAVSLVHQIIEIRAQSMVLCSDEGDFACDQLRWFHELQNRLEYLRLRHWIQFATHLSSLLAQVSDEKDKNLLRTWFEKKPKPHHEQARWLDNWFSWNLERLLHEIQTHLIESPRIRKEIANLTEFTRDHPVSATIHGLKSYVLIDEELNGVTFIENEENCPIKGPVSLSTAAIIDMIQNVSETFQLDLETEIEDFRTQMNTGDFQ